MKINSNISNYANQFILLCKTEFIKETKYPFVAIILFFIALILNIIQYMNNNQYLQDYVSPPESKNFIQNSLLYYFDVIGINGFIQNTPAHVLFILASYILLCLIECNIGHVGVFFFLLLCLMYQFFIGGYSYTACDSHKYRCNDIINSEYCCGSFILFAALGFCLFVIQRHLSIKPKLLVWLLIGLIWGGTVLYDYYITYIKLNTAFSKVCHIFLWHATNFLLGILTAYVISK
jgi:hypothetical protein